MPPTSSHILVVGLGNLPYPLTRHSVGHIIIDSLASRLGIPLKSDRRYGGYRATSAAVTMGSTAVTLTLYKPKTLMNISGKPVTDALHSSAIAPSNMVVIHDSLSHKPQTISPKFGGSANGHNGVRSIIAALRGNMDFHRLRIGIGRDAEVDSAEYVLGPLSSSERQFWGTNGEGTELVWRELSSMTGHMFGPR